MSRWLSVLLCACAVAISACGSSGDSGADNRYVHDVNAMQDRFERNVTKLQASISTSSTTAAADRRTLAALQEAIDAAVADLRRASVPESVASQHQRLVAAITSYTRVVRARRAVVGSTDPRALLAARTAFSSGSQDANDRIQEAIDKLNAGLRH